MASSFPSERPSSSRSLPLPRSPLIGRDAEVTTISALLRRDDVPLVTLVGPGGVGKTRLALHVAAVVGDHVADGVSFVPLAAISEPGLVLPTIATALGIPESGAQLTVDSVAQWLGDAKVLVVLDNLEQVVDAAPTLADLLTACPHLTLLVTSRIPLHITGEQQYAVQPLSVPATTRGATAVESGASAAVQLFIQRARAVQPDFTLSEQNAAAVAELCHRLDGLPLAIELAAARTKLLTPQALLDYAGNRLPLLTGGPRDAPARLRTMRNAIAWSYNLLPPDQQRLVRHLAVFVDGFTFEAAVATSDVLHDTGQAIERVAALVDQSLLIPAGEVAGTPRFTMLETIREFALDALAQSGEEPAVRHRHAAYFRDLAEHAEPALRTLDQPAWLARLEVELGNLRAVLDWSLAGGEVETGLRLAGALYWFWFLRNHVREGREWFERARAAGTEPISPAARAAAGAALLAWRAAEYATSKAYADEAIRLFASCDDQWGVALMVHHLGHIADDLEHDRDRSIEILANSVQLFATLGDPWGVAYSQRCLARVTAMHLADDERSTALLEEAAAMFRTVGDPWNLAVTLHMLGDTARERQQWATAIPIYQESLVLHWDERDPLGVADALLRLAQIHASLGDMETAASLFGGAAAQHEAAGVTVYAPVRAEYEQAVAAARTALGPELFEAAWQLGRARPLPQAVDLALSLPIPDAPSAKTTRPAGSSPSQPRLSAREREVLHRLVEGRSDREIAEALSISVRTVHTHVTSILNKLGVSSRTAAATYAIRHSLIDAAPSP